jgi:hypothetical protein
LCFQILVIFQHQVIFFSDCSITHSLYYYRSIGQWYWIMNTSWIQIKNNSTVLYMLILPESGFSINRSDFCCTEYYKSIIIIKLTLQVFYVLALCLAQLLQKICQNSNFMHYAIFYFLISCCPHFIQPKHSQPIHLWTRYSTSPSTDTVDKTLD